MPPIPSLPVRRSKSASRGPVRMSPSRKVRGLTLLATLAATLVTAVLAAFSVLLWWVPLIAVAAAGAAFLWLRAGVQSEIAARKAMRRRVVRTRTPRASTAAAPADRSAAAQQGSEWTAPEELLETTSVDAAASAGGVDAGTAVDTPADRPDGWQPVPVPPPTYTLKAKAERPLPSDDAAAVGEVPTASGTGESAPATGEMQDEQRAAYGT